MNNPQAKGTIGLTDSENARLESIRQDAQAHIQRIQQAQQIMQEAQKAQFELAKSQGALEALDGLLNKEIKALERKYKIPINEKWGWNPQKKTLEPAPPAPAQGQAKEQPG